MITISRPVHLLPVFWPLLTCIAIFTPYIMAVSLKHVYPFLPTISKTAAYEPEGSIFRFMTTLVALFGMMFLLARYLQIDTAVRGDLDQNIPRKVTKLNKVAVIFGLSSLLGVVAVANFQSNLQEVCQFRYLSAQLLYRCTFLSCLFSFSGGHSSFGLESSFLPFFVVHPFFYELLILELRLTVLIFLHDLRLRTFLKCSLTYMVYSISINQIKAENI